MNSLELKSFDKNFFLDGVKILAGTDEAGRGPLAGPVAAAAVIFSKDVFINGVNDSKKLSEQNREELCEEIKSKALCWKCTLIGHKKIDEINILQASLSGMKKSVLKLYPVPDLVLVDGTKIFYSRIKAIPIIEGDAKSFCIAAASIIAKVTRDKIMLKLAEKHPEYLWEKNKGYATKEHITALKKYGPTPYHRKTFLSKILGEQNEFEFK